jgi:solute carrier family 25 (mitochondrial aspartate/glutamate transporter), member 12/13
MQLNRPASTLNEEPIYRNTRDCLQKIAKHEGLRGFYRGLMPQVLGVSLGKAIKLTVIYK